jgi:hypothetical protein
LKAVIRAISTVRSPTWNGAGPRFCGTARDGTFVALYASDPAARAIALKSFHSATAAKSLRTLDYASGTGFPGQHARGSEGALLDEYRRLKPAMLITLCPVAKVTAC